MKKMKSTITSISLIGSLFCMLSILGCNSRQSENVQSESDETEVTAAGERTATKYFYINSPNNEGLAEIRLEEGQTLIQTPDKQYFGLLKEDKRKYYDAYDAVQFVIKYKEDGFKLRNHEENLLWKVKYKEGRIKIADNEEMTNAFEMKMKEGGRIKIEQNDEEVLSLRLSSGNSDAKRIGDKYLLRGFDASLTPAILMIDPLKETEKFILIAELLRRGK
ncbi:hypothetical protein QQ008_19890 [Fulvivirgaceae bacterium BMA10]|uniref:Lipoprotein n=1 Tax=Splendidivirga corallicola TaxID=3051826 RepID=A0ABT8KSB5_9BACT|nr:hypothetical protein [Fulvivirgaceae bacterium BMA10]